MKSIIKRIIVGVSITLLVCFINSCEVSAKSYTADVSSIRIFLTNGSTSNYTSLSTGTMGWETYKSVSFQNLVNNNYYALWKGTFIITSPSDIQENKSFDYSFRLWFPFGESDYSSFGYPTVTFGGFVCTVSPSMSYAVYDNVNSVFSSSSIVTYICQNVSLKPNQSYPLDFYISPTYNGNLSANKNYRIGINQSVSYVQNQQDTTNSSIQTLIQETEETNSKLDETYDLLTDTSTPANNDITNVTDKITNNNTNVSDLVNLIPNTLQVIVNGFNNGCSGGYSLGTLFGTELVIPCINPVDYLGSFVWGVIDSILCLCFLIPFAKYLVNTYNDLTSLKNRRLQ